MVISIDFLFVCFFSLKKDQAADYAFASASNFSRCVNEIRSISKCFVSFHSDYTLHGKSFGTA